MIDAVKEYLAPKRFGVVAYVCLIVHFLTGLALITVTSTLRAGEFGKFSCRVDKGSTTVYKIYVEKTCYSRYEQAYNSPLPLYGFVLLSTGVTVIVSVIYSLGVSRRVDDIDKTLSRSDESTTVGEETRQGLYVFYFYFLHLVARSLFGIVFTVMQYSLFYSDGFDFDFSCTLPASDVNDVTPQIPNNSSIGKFNNTSVACENTSASEKQIWSVIVAVLNIAFALIALGEVVYLFCRRFAVIKCRSQVKWSNDTEFITVYLLRKTYTKVDYELINLEDSIDFYKHKVLNAPRDPEICYAQNIDLNDLYIDVIITTGRAQHNFSKEMDRHEMFDVYMEVPESSVRLNEIKALFQPNTDTKDCFPRTILVVGRPGIGKSLLTKKIIHDWANTKDDEFYGGQIPFLIKFRWFSFDQLKNLSLETFLRYGTGLNEEEFESIYEEILKEPKKAIFIFDGLDEFNGDLTNCLEQSLLLPNDPNTCIPAINLFAKICTGSMLKGATVLVTSRPTAESFYSRLNFERSVEIIGFTPDKIEEYVTKFCDNNNRNDFAPKMWSHITNSSDLLNLCYIPVNCFIVCVSLSKCLSDPRNDSRALPATLTELYITAVDHFVTDRSRNLEETSSKRILQKLEELSYCGMKNGQLVFNKQHFDAEMRMSGLVNSLSNPIFPIQTQFCFIHLTIQEFLAASHVTKTLKPNAIEKFIFTNFNNSKWHLVLQFTAGLLGEKIKMSASNDYCDCCLAFAKSFFHPGNEKWMTLDFDSHVLVMRCLREVDDEDIVKQACEQTDLNMVTTIGRAVRLRFLSTSDWAAMTFLWKHLKNVEELSLLNVITDDNFLRDVSEFVQQRCLECLNLYNTESECNLSEVAKVRFFKSLMESKCTLDHEHVKFRILSLGIGYTDADIPNICKFIGSGRATHLQGLHLPRNYLTSCGIYQVCEVFNDGHCKELRYMNLSKNENLKDESVEVLCSALVQEQCVLLEFLNLERCSLTDECVNSLCTFLCDRHCKLKFLILEDNKIGDKGVSMLCTNALKREQCTLIQLYLRRCNLTDECVPLLCETLKDRNCSLTLMGLRENKFTEEYKNMLRNVANTNICRPKARNLKIWI